MVNVHLNGQLKSSELKLIRQKSSEIARLLTAEEARKPGLRISIKKSADEANREIQELQLTLQSPTLGVLSSQSLGPSLAECVAQAFDSLQLSLLKRKKARMMID